MYSYTIFAFYFFTVVSVVGVVLKLYAISLQSELTRRQKQIGDFVMRSDAVDNKDNKIVPDINTQRALRIIRDVFNQEEQEEIVRILKTVRYVKCPEFLGSFQYSRHQTGTLLRRLPELTSVIHQLQQLVPDQVFNTVFIQRYPEGSFVRRHRDPFNNVGKTIIAVFGEFKGGVSHHGDEKYQAIAGDVVVQDCTVLNDKGIYTQGKFHSVDTIHGERFAIILNTIKPSS